MTTKTMLYHLFNEVFGRYPDWTQQPDTILTQCVAYLIEEQAGVKVTGDDYDCVLCARTDANGLPYYNYINYAIQTEVIAHPPNPWTDNLSKNILRRLKLATATLHAPSMEEAVKELARFGVKYYRRHYAGISPDCPPTASKALQILADPIPTVDYLHTVYETVYDVQYEDTDVARHRMHSMLYLIYAFNPRVFDYKELLDKKADWQVCGNGVYSKRIADIMKCANDYRAIAGIVGEALVNEGFELRRLLERNGIEPCMEIPLCAKAAFLYNIAYAPTHAERYNLASGMYTPEGRYTPDNFKLYIELFGMKHFVPIDGIIKS